ncbi:P-loop containing nucleoside triphosphate hydrolase protein [Cytidiella melzeri]|nr:P-loop containing nucleoside triphosphate hydrolase protein [Cytidiella melzeri]
MSSSPSLNPASTPFFPGGGGQYREEDNRGLGIGFHRRASRERFATTSSSLSVSPTEYRSMKSSPSASSQDGLDQRTDGNDLQSVGEFSRQSPALGQQDNDRGFPTMQRQLVRESSMSAIPEGPPGEEDTPGRGHTNGLYQQNAVYTGVMGRARERLNTPPVAVEASSRASSFASAPSHFISSSPASSLDSGSMFAPSVELSASFESQLKSSPLINELFNRMDRYEMTTRDIQRELLDVGRKVDLLVERTLNAAANTAPEFSNPFASPSAPSFSTPDLNGYNGPRDSIIGSIPPNQPGPPDDISVMAHRLSSLTTSVDHLIALQQSNGPNLASPSLLGPSMSPNDLLPRGSLVPPGTGSGMLGHGMPSRPSPRLPGPPARTWSAGTLDIPLRAPIDSTTGSIGRADGGFRDKRRSVSQMLRRDSAATDTMSTSSRESGPVISKWDQLALAPDLLRSLSAFGVGPPNKIQQRALPFLLRGADIIAQAPPTQERIAAYVIPAIHIALIHTAAHVPLRGPLVIMISTTVDQATQAQRMIRDLGGPIGVRSALGVGATSANGELGQELRLLHQNMPHILCGTPQKLHALFTSPGGISGAEVRFLVLDEVDQLIARNLQDFVFTIVRSLPPPRSRTLGSSTPTPNGNGASMYSLLEGNGSTSSLNLSNLNMARRFSAVGSTPADGSGGASSVDRQTALFSNTVPQDVLNLATTIQLREPVRVLVRRDGNVTHADSGSGSRGLRQFYLYLAFTAGGGRSDTTLPQHGLGIIGSGRGATTSAETAQAREWKLDALADLFDDLEVSHGIIHVGGLTALESVVYKLASRGLEVVPLHSDMNAGTKLAALNKFRNPSAGMIRQASAKVLVVYDVVVKAPDVQQVPLVVNYDLPKAVEEYAHRVAPAMASNYSRAGVVINFVTATGGDVEMLRSIECFYKIKCPEVPVSLRDIV